MNNSEDFKLGILIPLKSKSVSQDWQVVCDSLRRTILAIFDQTDESFDYVVVGHDEPEFFGSLSIRDKFVQCVEFPPPDKEKHSGNELQLKYEFDRCTKIAKGMYHLHQTQSFTHWFALDADDVLCENFVEKVRDAARGVDAVVLKKGYFFYQKIGLINETSEFDQYCGSSLIVSAAKTCIPAMIDENAFKNTIFGKYSHVNADRKLKQKGFKIAYPNQPIITYVRENSENISEYYTSGFLKKAKIYVKALIKMKRLSRADKKRLNL